MNLLMTTERPQKDLAKLLAAGAGLVINAQSRKTSELIALATQATNNGVTIILRGMQSKSTVDLARVAAAGRGRVMFEL